MGGDLLVAILVFITSAGVVIYCGAKLAVYGDALATLTGWGRLFVGSLLIAFATSLPELSTNVSAVKLDPPNTGLALGDVLGSNMLNMFILAAVALVFGGKRFLVRVAPEQRYLAMVAIVLTGLAILLGSLKIGASIWEVGLSSIVLLVVFVIGMWVVYKTKPGDSVYADDGPHMSLRRAWISFGVVSAGVVISGFFLAWSADEIAGITGVASSTLGILLLAVVTSMPEVSATVAAARMGAADLGVGGLFGSCGFNATILFYSDLFYRDGILVNQAETAHFVAGGSAVALMIISLALILGRIRINGGFIIMGLALMVGVYFTGAILAASLGE
ncbi:MAG: sodium:calcium antiporter [Chloroflexi bacterium]|nr:sodium:calcium antiporter [Chloroflexota bacterium]